MSAANAKDAAEAWIASSGLPDELRGRVVQLVVFTSDEDTRFFYPRRALIWQQQVNTYTSRILRGRHAKITRLALTPAGYEEWRKAEKLEDSPDLRRRYADERQRPPGLSLAHSGSS